MEPVPVTIESFGCTMNHGEARRAAEILSSRGFKVHLGSGVQEEGLEGDLHILFTCDVISSTERRMWRRMEELTAGGKRLMVAGCLAAISPAEILRRFPDARILDSMGLGSLESSLTSMFEEELVSNGPDPLYFHPSVERIDTIVPISSGCAGNCSYCITRIARGGVGSYPLSEIAARISSGVMAGRKEVLLTSQDSAAYGLDMTGGDLGLLLRDITSVDLPDHRIRVGMMNPVLADERLDSILSGFDHPRVFKFFHVPVQSGSDRVLENMNRGYSVDEYRNMLRRIRERFPKASISTDLIIGFPGEEGSDHEKSMELIEEISPDVLNITRFSPRPGTPANAMKDQVKGWVQKERSREATKFHQKLLPSILKERLGHHQRCLITEVGKKGTMMARDENYTPIVIEAGNDLLGEFIDIDTSRTGPTYLMAGKDWKLS
ncbi:MAG: tRNA (N(6)-L-threonylcarbamoyladenosine(37)-C(2))-methylthiotransferase [Thermoplasmatota archaeon]